MAFDFDEFVNRRNTASVKWDMAPFDVLPLWVADMDFKAPNEVLEVLKERILHGIFGYTYPQDSYYQAVIDWMKRRHNWQIEKDWIIITPGIVTALFIIVQAFTKEKDAVLIQQPVYNPFMDAVIKNNRKLVNSPLVNVDGYYQIDFVDFEQKIIDNDVKLFIMCSPHNPVGRVWTKEELIKIGEICLKHNVLIVTDEIHHDLVFKGNKHIPFASISSEFSNQCITCTAPSKTFNLAGLKISNIIIENKTIRDKYLDFIKKISLGSSNIFGLLACEASYNKGEKWLEQVMTYIEDNKKLVIGFFAKNFPQIKITNSEATYLLWIDCRALNIDHKNLENLLYNDAKLWLNQGYVYGEEGEGFVRLNLACTREVLKEALERIKKVFYS